MKITRSTNKEQLKEFLNANYGAVKKADKTLAQSIMYASTQDKKDPKSVKRADLIDLAKQVMTVLGDKVVDALAPAPTPIVAENSVKPKLKAKGQKSAEKSEEEAPQQTAEPEKKSAPKGKTSPKAQSKQKKDDKAELQSAQPLATKECFPEVLELGDSGAKYALAEDIQSMEDLHNALNNDEEIVFAYYWNKRLLKQFPYFSDWLGHPKSFKDDLDIATTLYVSDEYKVAYQVSAYTEAVYTVLPTDFEVVDGIRVAGGIEFQIYRAVADEAEETE